MADTLVEEPRARVFKPPPRRKIGRPRRSPWPLILAAALLALIAAGYFLWRYFSSYESTDDAQIDGHIHSISARITGHIIQVPVIDQQTVKAGEVLALIDPRDYETAVARAEADVASARADVETSRTQEPITSVTTASNLESARAELAAQQAGLVAAQRQFVAAQARRAAADAQVREADAIFRRSVNDALRYQYLVDREEISRQQYDQSLHTAEANAATLAARIAAVNEAQQNITVAATAVEQARNRIAQAEAAVRTAETAPEQVAATGFRTSSSEARLKQQKAALEQAKLNLSYTRIIAPTGGIIGRKTVELGHNVAPGQQLMALVQLDDVWVIANFKETQLRRMQPGQRVRFSVDAYRHSYNGIVTAIGGATGSRFSLLPPENATGNFVKVVQRVPVRIDLDPNQNTDRKLRPGMSVDPKVFLR